MRILLLIFSIFITYSSFGQEISKHDSLHIKKAIKVIFDNFETADLEKFKVISTEKIYCLICFSETDFSDQPYMLSQEVFFDKHLKELAQSEILKRAIKAKDYIITTQENDHRSDYIIFVTTTGKCDPGVEKKGEQLGIYLKKVGGEYKFSGIETLP